MLCKRVHCADLGESFQTHISLQNLASIQPRTSPLKFAASRRSATWADAAAARAVLDPVAAALNARGDVNLAPGVGGCLLAQTWEGPSSAVSKPILQSNVQFVECFEVYNICTLLRRFKFNFARLRPLRFKSTNICHCSSIFSRHLTGIAVNPR